MKRFEIWFADLPRIDGSHVQQGFRPILIISNDRANTYSPVIIAIPLTSRLTKRPMPTHGRLRGVVRAASDRAAICHALAVQLDMAAA